MRKPQAIPPAVWRAALDSLPKQGSTPWTAEELRCLHEAKRRKLSVRGLWEHWREWFPDTPRSRNAIRNHYTTAEV